MNQKFQTEGNVGAKAHSECLLVLFTQCPYPPFLGNLNLSCEELISCSVGTYLT